MDAVIDIGSNSVRFMLYNPKLKINKKHIETTRLAEGTDIYGNLAESAMERTMAAVEAFYKLAKAEGAERIFVFATEAVRSASNGGVFVGKLSNVGISVDVLDKDTEAELGFYGAYDGGRLCVVDMGGASTEIAVGDQNGVFYKHSLPLGIVRLTDMEKRGADILKTAEERVKEYGKIPEFDKVYAIGGTAGTMVAIRDCMEVYDQNKVHGSLVTLAEVEALYNYLKNKSIEELYKVQGLSQKRAPVICAGIMLWNVIMRYLGVKSVTVGERDNMEGYILRRAKPQLRD